jgi:N-acetylmuramoyl-L-alanine amidase
VDQTGKRGKPAMRAQSFVLSFSILFFAVVSCARFPFTSPPDPLYRELSESFTDYDAAVLVGRTIVLDPGHGGRFDGAIGRYKTREADAVKLRSERHSHEDERH